MAKALLILAEGFEEIEAVAPIDLLRRAGVEVTVAGLDGLAVKGARGVFVTADAKLDQASGNFDALVLPGGRGAEKLAASEKVKVLVQEYFKKGKWVCAICASPVLVLSPTGILDGKSATCYKGMENDFGAAVKYVDKKVVVDGNVITSQGPGTAVAFGLTIVEKLCGQTAGNKLKEQILA